MRKKKIYSNNEGYFQSFAEPIDPEITRAVVSKPADLSSIIRKRITKSKIRK